MKPLILSFFGALLVYSLFFDQEENKEDRDLRLHPDSIKYEQNVLKKQADSVATLYVQPANDMLTKNSAK